MEVEVEVPATHLFSVSAMCVKDKILLTSGADGKIRMWALESGGLLRDIEEIYDAVYDVVFQDAVGKEIVPGASRNGRTVLDVS